MGTFLIRLCTLGALNFLLPLGYKINLIVVVVFVYIVYLTITLFAESNSLFIITVGSNFNPIRPSVVELRESLGGAQWAHNRKSSIFCILDNIKHIKGANPHSLQNQPWSFNGPYRVLKFPTLAGWLYILYILISYFPTQYRNLNLQQGQSESRFQKNNYQKSGGGEANMPNKGNQLHRPCCRNTRADPHCVHTQPWSFIGGHGHWGGWARLKQHICCSRKASRIMEWS